MSSPTGSTKGSVHSKASSNVSAPPEPDDGTTPDFIYGGPFIIMEKPVPILDMGTPVNVQLQGTFKKSYAYYSLKERMPIILTKIIDYLSREGAKVSSSCGAQAGDVQNLIHYISKLKNELVTNKEYSEFKVDTEEAEKWNEWIKSLDNKHYFTNAWVWTECYIYRRIREGCELYGKLSEFDPFEEQKRGAFTNGLEPMCVVAERVLEMIQPNDAKDKRKADFVTLLKICLWANKCDLSQSLGEPYILENAPPPEPAPAKKKGKAKAPAVPVVVPPPPVKHFVDPFQMIIDLKDKLLTDDTSKIADQVQTKADNVRKAIATAAAEIPVPPPAEKPVKGAAPAPPPPPPAPVAGAPENPPEEKPKIPCPAKMVVAQTAMFDIVCDNVGYELFADLCLAHFLVAQNIVQKVRFHVKKYPWFISDVTPKDFKHMLSACCQASFNKQVPADPKPAPAEGEPEPPPDAPRNITSTAVQQLGQQWTKFYEEGVFQVMSEDFWTYPHVYKDMKKYDPNMYRKLQYAVAVMFKGDLNYRKLLGERKCNPYMGLEPSLQGFIPAPIIAVRVVKSELICAMPKGRYEVLNKLDEKWMEKGVYGVIQFCAKAEALKVSDRPCADYGDTCRGLVCPIHTDM